MPETLKERTIQGLVEVGMRQPDAATVADNLIYANLRGIDGHGVVRLGHYLDRMRRGSTRPDAEPEYESLGTAVGMVDAKHGMGQVAGAFAAKKCQELARANGIGLVTVKNSGHFGAAGFYGQEAAEAGLITMVFANTDKIVVPFGGRFPFFGSNPIAFVFPGADHPVTVDMATSAIPYGKVVVAQQEGREIPETWGLDAEGNATTDPSKVAALHPMAGPKGYGLAFAIELLCSGLTGGPFGPDIPAMYGDEDKERCLSHTFIMIDTEKLGGAEAFKSHSGGMMDRLRAGAPAEGFTSVMAPGDPERRIFEDRSANGIPVDGLGFEI